MFDRNDVTQVQNLKSEIVNDPLALGYIASSDSWPMFSPLLNDPKVNTGGEVSESKKLTGYDFLEAVITDAVEYAVVVNNSAKEAFVNFIFNFKDQRVPFRLRSKIMLLFNEIKAPNIRAAIITVSSSRISRAEVLFGEDTVITLDDVRTARKL